MKFFFGVVLVSSFLRGRNGSKEKQERKEDGVALFQDVGKNLVFQFCFEYSYDTDEYKCYSNHFSDEIVENDFAYFIVENYEQSCRNVKEVLKMRE